MILNTMQQRVVASKKRITVITAQAGSGSSTALLYALIEVAKNDPTGLVLFCRATDIQSRNQAAIFAESIPNARYSPRSQILTVRVGLTRKVKIKFVDSRYHFNDSYVSAIAFDHNIDKDVLRKVLLVAGRIYINDWSKNIAETWGIDLGLVVPVGDGLDFIPAVENIKGLTVDNPGLPQQYIDCIKSAPPYLKSTDL